MISLSMVSFMLPGVGPSAELQAGLKGFSADGAIEIRENAGLSRRRSERRGAASPPPVVGESQSNAPLCSLRVRARPERSFSRGILRLPRPSPGRTISRQIGRAFDRLARSRALHFRLP
jgi:hypothetical protein